MERQPSELFLSGLQKLEFGRCSLFPSWSAQGLIGTTVVGTLRDTNSWLVCLFAESNRRVINEEMLVYIKHLYIIYLAAASSGAPLPFTREMRQLRILKLYVVFGVLDDGQGDRGGTVMCYKSEGHWFNPRWCHWNFSLT